MNEMNRLSGPPIFPLRALNPPTPSAPPAPRNDDADDSDEEVKRMTSNTKEYMTNYIQKGATTQGKFRVPTGPRRGNLKNQQIPKDYTCHRCGVKGHLISDCPTNGNPEFDIKKSPKGIPKNLKKENLPEQVEDKYIKSIVNDEITYFDNTKGIMSEFQCQICQKIFEQPTIVPCCKTNF